MAPRRMAWTTFRVSLTQESMTTFNPGLSWRSFSKSASRRCRALEDRAKRGRDEGLSGRVRWPLRQCWRFGLCARPLRAGCGCSAAFLVRHPPAKCWRFRSSGSSCRSIQNGFLGNEKRKFATSAGFAFDPDFAVHALEKAARNGEAEAHAFGGFASWQTKEIIENFQVKLGGDS